MNSHRLRVYVSVLIPTIVILIFASIACCAENPKFRLEEDVIYGRKFGTALTMDVFHPAHTNNGLGIIFVVSGGWFSSKDMIQPLVCLPLLEHGYTVFAVLHGSQPKYQVPEIIQDMNRSVRFIRHNAKRFKIDPDRLGIYGGSAGGHLTLILATQGGPGAKDAPDPVDRESSAVQCAACFFPPTDFLNYGAKGSNGMEGILAVFKPAFGELPKDPEALRKYGKSVSPIYFISSNLPPVLIIHGDADVWVPIQQSISFVERAKAAGAEAKLMVKKGANHGWPGYEKDVETFAEWFDEHLTWQKGERQK